MRSRSSRSVFFCACIVGLALVSCSRVEDKDAAKSGAPPVAVSVIEATPTRLPFTLDVVGQAEGSREVEVRARVGGILMKRLYEEGTQVKAGQPLFEIDKAPYEIALAQAKGQLGEQKARLEQSRREAERLRSLLEQRAISRKEYDDATATAAVSEAGVQAAEAAVRQAALNLSYAVVTAPVGGISGRAEHSEGALISTGSDSLLTTIVQSHPVWVRFGVSDGDLAALRGGENRRRISKVEAIFSDGSVYSQPGRINFESAQVDRQLGTIVLRAEFDNPKGVLIPGQFVRVRLLAGNRSVMLLPQTAVLQTDNGTSVFIAGKDGTAQPRQIKTDGWSGNQWVVVSGLEAGDKVIADNLLKLKAGAKIKVDDAPKAANSAAAAKFAEKS